MAVTIRLSRHAELVSASVLWWILPFNSFKVELQKSIDAEP